MCPDTYTVRSGRNLYREWRDSFFFLCIKTKNYFKTIASLLQIYYVFAAGVRPSLYTHMYCRPYVLVLLAGKVLNVFILAVSFSISMTSHPTPSLCGFAKDKAELFRERYTILQQVSELCSLLNFQIGKQTRSLCCYFQYV